MFHYVSPFIEQAFDFHAGVYGEDPPDVKGRTVYLVDFSYKRQVIKDMIQKGGAANIVIIDHHKTAIEDLQDLDDELYDEALISQAEKGDGGEQDYESQLELVFDLEMSGATLAWKYWNHVWETYYLHRPVLLGHVEDRDLWKFRLPMTREIQANVFSYEYTFANWDKLMLETNVLTLAEGGAAIERKHHKDIAELVKVCQRFIAFSPVQMSFFTKLFTDADIHVPIASLPYTLTSDAGHLMAKQHMDGKAFAMCYWDTAEHRIFSLRSTEEGMDVSNIAKAYGGGGHKHAAGFKVPRSHWLAQV